MSAWTYVGTAGEPFAGRFADSDGYRVSEVGDVVIVQPLGDDGLPVFNVFGTGRTLADAMSALEARRSSL